MKFPFGNFKVPLVFCSFVVLFAVKVLSQLDAFIIFVTFGRMFKMCFFCYLQLLSQLQFPESVVTMAKELYRADSGESPHPPAWPIPTDEEIEAAILREEEMSDTKEKSVPSQTSLNYSLPLSNSPLSYCH